jgi:ribonuclease BN (tRNA processing enzyme)
MSNPILTFLGSDAGFGDNNNSAYLEIDNKLILIDCGITVFNKIKQKFDFKKYEEINIIITHLHNDHAGSLSQFILYLWYMHNVKATVLSACEHIKEFLTYTGTPDESYTLLKGDSNVEFIKTEHAQGMDCYGFRLKIDDKSIVYTGDTKILEPFLPYLENANEFYVDVSKNGGVHLKFEDVIPELEALKNNGINVYLMHTDDKAYISEKNNNEFVIVKGE